MTLVAGFLFSRWWPVIQALFLLRLHAEWIMQTQVGRRQPCSLQRNLTDALCVISDSLQSPLWGLKSCGYPGGSCHLSACDANVVAEETAFCATRSQSSRFVNCTPDVARILDVSSTFNYPLLYPRSPFMSITLFHRRC